MPGRHKPKRSRTRGRASGGPIRAREKRLDAVCNDLRSNEALFRGLVESASDWVWEVDENAVYTYSSPRSRDLIGYEPEEVVGKTPFDFMPPDEVQAVRDAFDPIMERREPIPLLENTLLHKNGSLVVVQTAALPVFDDDGVFRGYRGGDRDVTDRKRAEEELCESRETYRRLVEEIEDCLWELDENVVITYMSPAIERLLGYTSEEVVGHRPYDFMEKEDAEQLSQYMQSILKTVAPISMHPIRVIHRDGRKIVMQLNAKPILDEHGRVTGYRGIARDITDLVRAEDELRESRETYRRLVEEIVDCLWEVDENTVFTYMGPQAKRMLGHSPEDMIGRRPYDFMAKADADEFYRDVQLSIQAVLPMVTHPIRMIHEDGSTIEVQLNAKPILDDSGRVVGYRGTARDTTDLARAETELRESREKYKRLVEEINDCLWELDEQVRYTFLSPQTERILGYSSEEMLGRSPFDFMAPEDVEPLRGMTQAIAARGDPIPMLPVRMLRKDGGAVVVEISGKPILDDAGEFRGYRGMARDITEQSLARSALQESKEKYRRLVEDIDDVVWEVDENLYYTYISPKCWDLVGYSPEELVGTCALDLFAPQDAERAHIVASRRESLDRERLAHRRKDGDVVVLEVSARPTYDSEGNYRGYRGITRDVTEQVRAQTALQESEERYRGLVEDIDDVVWEVDTDLRYTYVSPRASAVLGYAPEEFVGHSILELATAEDLERATTELLPIAARRGVLDRAQVRLPNKSGGYVILEISARPMFDSEGNYRGYRGITRDVTEQVRYQQRLARLSECLLSFGPDAMQNIQQLTELAGELLGADMALYNRMEEGRLRSWARYNAPPDFVLDDRPEGHICYDVIQSENEDVVVIGDLPHTPYAERLSIIEGSGWKTYVGKSVKLAEKHVGSLCCIYRKDYVPGDEDRRLLGIIASAIGIEDSRLQAGLARRRSEEFLEAVFDGIQDGISVLDSNLNVMMVNRRMEEWIAHDLPFAGRKCYEAFHCRGGPCPMCPTLRAIEHKTLQSEVMRQEAGEGRPTWIELYAHPLINEKGEVWAVVEFVRDVTKQRAAQEEVERLSRRNELILNTAGEGILGVDIAGHIGFVNPAGARMLGYEPDELVGMPSHDTLHHTKPSGAPYPREECPYDAAMQDGLTHYIFDDVYWKKDGSSIPVDCVTAPIWENGAYVGAVTVFRDISERKLAEEQRRAFEKQLEAQKRHFYRETILSVTDGKLDICEQAEIRPYVSSSAVRIDVREPSDVSTARHEVARYCLERGASSERLDVFMIGVGEAITNALKHAKGGRVYAGADDGMAWVAVADRGGGISSLILPKATLLRGYSTKPSLGLGYTIMLEVSDRILLKTGERGTTVVLVHELCEPGREVKPDQITDTWQTIAT